MRKNKVDDEWKQCPKCGYRFEKGGICPRCGYMGYYPMSPDKMRKIRWILYPIILAIAIAILLLTRGFYIGGS